MIDLNSDFGRRVAGRLEKEQVIWLTTLDSKGMPQPKPVWFLWDGQSFLIYSEPKAHKVAHIARNPKVALNLNSDEWGNNVIIFTGEASLAAEGPPAHEVADYVTKYQEGMASINLTPEQFAESFSAAIRVKPVSLRGH
jgi:PPOX class probable F420-dependent enzyme